MDEDTVVFHINATNEKIIKRKARPSDLPAIQTLGESVDFHVGLHNAQLYFETSSDTWYVAVNGRDELIAYDTHNKLPLANTRQGYQLVVRPDYRGYGLTRIFETMHYSKYPAVGNATGDSLLRYKFKKFGDKLIGFEGYITDDVRQWIKEQQQEQDLNNSDVKLEKINSSNLSDVLAYDLSVLGFERSVFLSEWILPNRFPCRSMGILAKGCNGKIRGFGAIREYDGYFMLSPLYADEDSTARRLLYALASETPSGYLFYIHFPAKNRLITEFAHLAKFTLSESEIRYYINEVPKPYPWDLSRVYALHDYYPV